MNPEYDELLVLAETLGEVKSKTEKLEAEFSTQARPLEAATNALSAALSGIKALQFHVLDNNLGQLSARVEEMRKAVDEQVGVIALELKKADETNAAKAGQEAEALRSEIAALQAQLGTLGAQFSAQLERVEFSAKEEAKKLQLIPGPAGAAGASLNPRGTFVDGETYNRLDVVSWLGSSYIASVDGVTEKPSRNSNQWQVLASRGGGAAGGAGDFGSLAGVAQINQGGTGQTTRAAGLNALLPSQTGNVQYMLLTDGAGTVSWGAQPVAGLPSQTSNSGKLLTTDGTNASWSNAVTVSGSNATVTGTLTAGGGILSAGVSGSVTVNSTGSGALKIDNPTNPNLYFYSNGALKTQINYVASSSSFVVDHADQSEIKLNVFGGGTTTVGGRLLVSSTTASTSTSTGALVVGGGLGVGGNINAGGYTFTSGTLSSFSSTAGIYNYYSGGVGVIASYSDGSGTRAQTQIAGSTVLLNTAAGNALTVSAAGVVAIPATTASTSTSTGALVIGNGTSGGLGVGGAINAGGNITTTGATQPEVSVIKTGTGAGTGSLGIASDGVFVGSLTAAVPLNIWASGAPRIAIDGTRTAITSTTASTSTSSGALVVSGGVGVAGAGFFGGNIVAAGNVVCGSATNQAVSIAGGTANDGGNVIVYGSTHASDPNTGRIRVGTTTITSWDSNDFTIASGKGLRVGNAYAAGAPTATGYIVIKDSTGTSYKIPAVAL